MSDDDRLTEILEEALQPPGPVPSSYWQETPGITAESLRRLANEPYKMEPVPLIVCHPADWPMWKEILETWYDHDD